MGVFAYKATDQTASLSGVIAADSPRQARDLLRERGLVVQELEDVHVSSSRVPLARRIASAGSARTTLFVRELSVLLGVGVPLTEALATLQEQYRGRFRWTIMLLRDRVVAGASLASAMRDQPDVFDELCISLTEVGEDAGTLEATLQRLAEFRERSQQFRGRIVTALIYPVIVLVMAILASLFLMTFVVPQILTPLIELGQPLPLPTRIVKGASDFILRWWWALLTVPIVAAIALSALLNSATGRRALHGAILRVPILGDLVLKQSIVRLVVVLGTLLRSGIVFVRALQVAGRATPNLVLRDALQRCERAVGAGEDISDALRRTAVFPPMVVQLFAVGESAGKLEDMLDRLAVVYDQQVATVSQRLAAVLEPVLIIVLALIVLVIVLATVLPILEAGNAVI